MSNKTDFEKLTQLLTEFGVEFTTDKDWGENKKAILCKEGKDKVVGYPWFYTRFVFDDDGDFIEMGAYE